MDQEHEPTPEVAAEPANDAVPEPTPEARIQALEAEVSGLKDQALRALAETENVRRRGERERAEAGKYAIAKFAEALLNVADSLRQALGSAAGSPPEALRHGVELTERALTAALEAHGVTRFDPLGEAFDPHRHQAVFEIEATDTPAGTIAQTLRAGFMLNDRLLRPAMVAVAKGGAGAVSAPGLHIDTNA